MNKLHFALLAAFVTPLFVASCGEVSSSKIENTENDVIPNEVVIGNQVWMTKNLNVDKFRTGELIPQAKTQDEWEFYSRNSVCAWCYYDFNPYNGERYGKLYNWYAVNSYRGLAPEGWHIPSDQEWDLLKNNLGDGENVGRKMKSKWGWSDNGNGTNSSGFNALPSGIRQNFFQYIGQVGMWWSSTEDESKLNAGVRSLGGNHDYLSPGHLGKDCMVSVRCVRN